MPLPYDLTDNKILATYGRLVQYVSSSYYDGFGNAIPIGSATASYLSGSGMVSYLSANEITASNVAVDTLNVNQNINLTGILIGTSSVATVAMTTDYAVDSKYSVTSSYLINNQNFATQTDALAYAIALG